MAQDVPRLVGKLHRQHFRELVAPTIRVLGSFAAAEDAAQEAFVEALRSWPRDGVPEAPLAWLRRVTRNRALDRYRKRARWAEKSEVLTREAEVELDSAFDREAVEDDVLRLVFTCCHPSLAPETQIALTLRTVCGLTSDEVARAFLVATPTLQQRLVRARRKLDRAGVPYEVPDREALPGRLEAVLRTIYLVFNEGYDATRGDRLVRGELCEEAIRLTRWLGVTLPERSEPLALLALMLLHHSRREARVNGEGELVRLEEQRRELWDRSAIEEALPLVELSLKARPPSPYAIEAAIAALHAQAESAEGTDWPQIAALYTALERASGASPVVALNAAVARALAGDLDEGLRRLDALEAEGKLARYHLLPAARADLLARAGRHDEARKAYQKALSIVGNDVERRFLERRMEALD
ncbi:MAG: sigma-70 family RNA polymerase sigma factor [Myxococcota bacterium]